MSQSLTYRKDIDGLRGIAVLLVLVFHFRLLGAGDAGFLGVDVFFVISGFLITSILRRRLDAGSLDLKEFYLARIRRLAPALFATLVLTLAAGWLWLFPADFVQLAKQVLVSQAYVANIYYWRSINYFGLSAETVFLLHTWSLAVEEQFYLLYPVALILVHRYAPRHLGRALAAGCALSFALNVTFVGIKPEATFYLLPTRAWELLAGALITFAAAPRSRIVDEWLGMAGLVSIGAGVAFYGAGVRVPGFFALLPVTGAALVILSGAGARTLAARLLCLPVLVHVGRISYSLYLVHWPVSVFAALLLGENYSLGWRLGLAGASVGLAATLYHIVEQPFRTRRLLSDGARLARGYMAGLATTGALFLLVYGTAGLPQRFPDEVIQLAAYASDNAEAPECEYKGAGSSLTPATLCRIGTPRRDPTWMIYGDSHAQAAKPVFDEWLRRRGESGLFIFSHACLPVSGVHGVNDRGRCLAFNSAVLAFLAAHRELGNVALVSTWRQVFEAAISDSPDGRLSRAESIRLFDRRFAATLEELHADGKRIFVWEPVPGARQSVPFALARAALTSQPADILVRRDEYLATYAFFFDAVRRNRHLIARTFSPARAVCAGELCAATVDGKPLYADTAHITESSAGFWVKVLELD